MSSPFVPQSFMYGDLPQGGALTPIVVAARNPSNTVDKQYAAGYLWLSSLDMYQIVGGVPTYGSGNLYYQAGNSAGNPNWVLVSDASGPVVGVVGTANQITATNVAGTVTLSIPAAFIAPGSIASTTTITAGTGITATTGDITATAGDLNLNGVDSKININATTAASASVGVTSAMVGGEVTITSSAITASSVILYSRNVLGTAMGYVSITAQAPGSAVLTSDEATETSTFNYLIIN